MCRCNRLNIFVFLGDIKSQPHLLPVKASCIEMLNCTSPLLFQPVFSKSLFLTFCPTTAMALNCSCHFISPLKPLSSEAGRTRFHNHLVLIIWIIKYLCNGASIYQQQRQQQGSVLPIKIPNTSWSEPANQGFVSSSTGWCQRHQEDL